MSSKNDLERERTIFKNLGINPTAPIDTRGIDAGVNAIVRRNDANNQLQEILSQTKDIYTRAIGKNAGGKRRRKTKRRKSIKSKKSRRYRK